jgi:hypothetical protein
VPPTPLLSCCAALLLRAAPPAQIAAYRASPQCIDHPYNNLCAAFI